MKKNKKSRVFSRVIHHLSWANVFRVRGEKYNATVGIRNAYKEVLAAKRLIEEFGGKDVIPLFYDREWHIQFAVYHTGDVYNCYYTVSVSHGFTNDYHITNSSHFRQFLAKSELERDVTLRRDYSDYQMFRQYVDEALYWILNIDEYDDYRQNGNINDIPYDVSIRLWRDLRECAGNVVNEAVAHRKVVL